jgi:hypothetical protein
MKKLIIILTLFLTACGELLPADGEFVCVDVDPYHHLKMYKYRFQSTKGRVMFCTVDSANKYIVGDTIYLTKNPEK